MVTCNTTLEDQYIDEIPYSHGVTFHHIGLVISALFALIATTLSTYLIFMHATHYSRPYIQKHIIRILFMVPIYSIVSFLSYLYYRHAVYFQVLMGCYEAFAIASFFTLLCHYIAPTLHDQKEYFRGIRPKHWVLPLSTFKRCAGGDQGFFRTPRSGLTWFNICFLGVFQYCFIRVFMTFISVITEATGRYCEASLNPAFAHVWTMVFEAAAVTVAMYCLIQFYYQLKEDLAPYKPLLKIICIKLVIFFSFWQSFLISALTSTHALKPSKKINYADFKVGVPSMLLCIEMAIFSVLHLFAFSWKEFRASAASTYYDGNSVYQGGSFGYKAYLEAYNPWDIIKAVGRSFRWLFVGRRRRLEDISYKNHHPDALGLEPTRTQTEDSGPPAKTEYVGAAGAASSQPGKYQPVNGDDRDGLLAHAQPQQSFDGAATSYGGGRRRPGMPDGRMESADVGDQNGPRRWNAGPDHLMASHPGPGTVNYGHHGPHSSGQAPMWGGAQGQQSGVTDPNQPAPNSWV